MNNPIVSVIIPCHNAGDYLPQCLESLISQTLKEVQFIFVNDGSTDNTASVLDSYAAKDKRIRILTQEQRGAASARNRAISEAEGTYLSFLDADDFFETDFFEKAVQKLDQSHSDICLVNADLYDNQTGSFRNTLDVLDLGCLPFRQPFAPKDVANRLFQLTNSNAWSKLLRKELVLSHGIRFQELPNTNDLYFAYMSLALAKRIVYVPQKLIHYRVNLKESIQGTSWKSPLAFTDALDALKTGLKKHQLFELFRDSYQEECRRCCTYYFMRTDIGQINEQERIMIQKNLGLSFEKPILPIKESDLPHDSTRIAELIGVRKRMAAQKGWKYTLKWDLWKLLEQFG